MKNDIYNFLYLKLPFFKFLNENEKNNIINNCRHLTLKKGYRFYPKIDLEGLIIIKSGHINALIFSDDGREIVLYKLTNNSIDILCDDKFLQDIEFLSEENTEILLIPCKIFTEIKNQNIKALIFEKDILESKIEYIIMFFKNILFTPVKNRILNFLYNLNISEINITHEELAKNIGSSRETVSRNLKILEKEGSIIYKRGKITLLNFIEKDNNKKWG